MFPWTHGIPMICTAHSRQSPYFTMGRPFPTLSHGGSGPPLMHGPLRLPKSTTQTASQSVQSIMHGSRSWPTDLATPSLTTGCIYVRSTAMRPNNLYSVYNSGREKYQY